MRKLLIVSALVALSFNGSQMVRAQTSRSPEAQFKAAQYKQNIERDPKGAIKDYERLSKGPNRDLAARALLQMAECYRQLSDAQARPIYERVLKDFGDQPQALAMAREGLASLAQSGDTGHARLLTTLASTRTSGFRVLDDGTLGGTDWNTGDLVAIDPGNGHASRLVAGTMNDPDPSKNTWAESPVLSPDHRSVAYTFYDDGTPGGHFLRVLKIGDARPRTLIDTDSDKNAFNPYAIGWAPDGSSVLASIERRNTDKTKGIYELAWIPLDGGAIRVVHRLEGWRLDGNGLDASLSPDGRFIAFAARAQQDSRDRGIYIIPAAGGTEVALAGTGNNAGPIWSPDGRRVMFANVTALNSEIRSIAVSGGKPSGAPERLRTEKGSIEIEGITRTGTLHYVVNNVSVGIAIVDMTDRGAHVAGSRMQVTDSFTGTGPSWSPDGSFIAFKKPIADGNGYQLIVRTVADGAERIYVSNKHQMGEAAPRWRSLRTVQPMGLERTLVTVGQRDLTEGELPLPLPPVGPLSTDARVGYSASDDGTITMTTLATGAKASVTIPANRLGAWAVSPDGRSVATVRIDRQTDMTALTTASFEDGVIHTRLLPIRNQQLLTWTQDSRRVLLSEGSPKAGWRVVVVDPAGTGEPAPTGVAFEAQAATAMTLSPDGRRLAIVSRNRATQEWTLETTR